MLNLLKRHIKIHPPSKINQTLELNELKSGYLTHHWKFYFANDAK